MRIRQPSWFAPFAAPAFTFRADRRQTRETGRSASSLAFCFGCLLFLATQTWAQSLWQSLRKDGVHDPKSPAIKLLQEPAEALSKLPPDNAGNMVSWVKARQSGVIRPRASLNPAIEAKILDLDILMDLKGSMPVVLFPHRRHTEWLDCSNCHDKLFKAQTGASHISMLQILNGEQCGVCHGAVAFPLTECYRCHSVGRKTEAPRRAPPAGYPTPPPHATPQLAPGP